MKKENIFGNLSILPKEEILQVKPDFKKLKIGIPKESSFQENRISLTPEAVSLLINNGHSIVIESNAGLGSNFSDKEFSDVGAKIVFNTEEVFNTDVIVKIEPPTKHELTLLKKGQKLISAIQLKTRSKSYFNELLKKNITSIAIEQIRDIQGELPLLRSMSEIAGNTSLLIASEYLSNVNKGKGLMLGGITGVPPTEVVIIGAGTVGEYACRTAMGLGCNIIIFDTSLLRLKRIQDITNRNISTSILHPNNIRSSLKSADVVIGALRSGDGKTPCVVSSEMIKSMKEGSVIVDVSIDQGGCFETSEVTSHNNPVFKKHGIVHYCVPNIPSRVARSSTFAVCNVILPILLNIGIEGGLTNLIKKDIGLRNGVYTFSSMMTNKTLSKMFDFKYKDLNLILPII